MTMNPDDPPEPVALLEAGCGASDPGACAVAPDPPPATDSPGTPLRLITTPEVGAVSVVWLRASWAAWTWAWAEATCAWAEASAFGLTWVCTARLSRDEVTCWDDELIRDWPLIASICCLLWSLASRVLSCVQAIEPGSIPQSVLTFAWSVPLTTEVTVRRSALAVRIVAAAGFARTVSRAINPTSNTATRPRPASQARVPVSQARRRSWGSGFSVGACRITASPTAGPGNCPA